MHPLYIHDDGRLACREHVGNYAGAALERRPDARLIQTRLGTWERLSLADIAQLVEMAGRDVRCEICESIERRQRRPELRRVK